NAQFQRSLQNNKIPATVEVLSAADQVNEYLLTGLRTIWGCEFSLLNSLSGDEFATIQRSAMDELQQRGWLQIGESKLTLTAAGKLFADRVASELFID